MRQRTRDYRPEYMLISIRNLNTVAVIDGTSTHIKWIASGLTLRQHAPRYLRGNRILVFDNLGGSANQGGSRLAEIDLASHAVTTLFPRMNTPPELDFFSEIAGHVSLDSERSRALVSLTMRGRIVEVDLRTGEVLWEYENTYDVTPYTEASGKGADQRFAKIRLHWRLLCRDHGLPFRWHEAGCRPTMRPMIHVDFKEGAYAHPMDMRGPGISSC